jgi:pimeloyl-ACP methyl ester carboxylesterase
MSKLALLFVLTLSVLKLQAQKTPFGNNPDAGSYFDAGGVKLYYEIYGKGEPILMLHGGVYGYISEFEFLIPKLSEKHRVICLATRGHGKSEIGHEAFSEMQKAKDAYQLLKHLKIDSLTLVGFSDGAFTALKMAEVYPKMVKKVVAMGIGDIPKRDKNKVGTSDLSSKKLLAQNKEFFESRLKLMPEPNRWDESLQMMNEFYNTRYMSDETFCKIKCPVLVMTGERDDYFTVDQVVKCYKSIPNAQLSIIPGCHHVILYCNFPAVWESMKRFIE